jgi:23S rRNA (adenine1618-N6)-methyltransferase
VHPRSRFRSAGAPSRAHALAPAANPSLLAQTYQLQWSVPGATRAPDVRVEADYVHHVADLLSGGDDTAIPRGDGVRVLDLATGAGCLRPLIGASEYGWRFVAVDRDQAAHRWGRQIVRINRAVAGRIEGRHQADASAFFAGVTTPGERFAACLYDPAVDGGPGREIPLAARLITESAPRPTLCVWFTVVVASRAAARQLHPTLSEVAAADVREVAMTTGTTRRVLLAWTFVRTTP